MLQNILVISGFDPCGASGILNDIKIIQNLGVHGCGVITCNTIQQLDGVIFTKPVEISFFENQLLTLLNNFSFSSIKVGLLPSPEYLDALLYNMKDLTIPIVIDPIFNASSNHSFTNKQNKKMLLDAYRYSINEHNCLITPNLMEAFELANLPFQDFDALNIEEINELLVELKMAFNPHTHVLLKGGHITGSESTDYLISNNEISPIKGNKIQSGYNYRGTGCALSSAIAVFWAKEKDLLNACVSAKKFLYNVIANAQPTNNEQIKLLSFNEPLGY